jgi:hypothetical protein
MVWNLLDKKSMIILSAVINIWLLIILLHRQLARAKIPSLNAKSVYLIHRQGWVCISNIDRTTEIPHPNIHKKYFFEKYE